MLTARHWQTQPDRETQLTAIVAAPGASPTLMGGTTITGAMDAINPTDDMASAPDGWGMKTLFRDWGDTAGDGDGGYETAAIVVKNLGEGTAHPFDRMLSMKVREPGRAGHVRAGHSGRWISTRCYYAGYIGET